MRHLAHLAARLYNAPLMLLPSVADTIAAVFAQALQGSLPAAGLAADAVEGLPRAEGYAGNVARGAKFADKPYVVTEAGVALLPVYGALVQRAGQIDANCMPIASYQRIGATLQRMQQDPDVKAILMELDSPGGEAAGNFDLAAQILAARDGGKPIWGHANEGAYSAAYSLGAAVQRLHTPQAGSVGSIGVVMLHMDQSERDRKQGVAYTSIFAGARKVDFNSHAPLSAEARALGQAEVNRLYDMFTTHVATARGLDLQVVRGTEAGILPAHDAKALGLIDAVSSFSDTLAELTDLVSRPARSVFTTGATRASSQKGGTSMSQTQAEPGAATVTEAEATRREQAAAATARTEGQAAERARISGILNHAEAAGRPGLARSLAFDTDMAVEPASRILAAAAKEPGTAAPAAAAAVPASPLAAAMAGVPNPPVAAAGQPAEDSPASLAANVVALHRQVTGAK